LEKELRLVETMKINGLLKRNYWVVNYVSFLSLYSLTMLTYYLFGRFVSGLGYFKDTSPDIIFWWLLGWGMAQVSMAFFMTVFLSSS